jgi:hypothetical protein
MLQETVGFVKAITGWGARAYSCSPQSHALMYSIIAMAILMSFGGIFVYKRFIRTQPAPV